MRLEFFILKRYKHNLEYVTEHIGLWDIEYFFLYNDKNVDQHVFNMFTLSRFLCTVMSLSNSQTSENRQYTYNVQEDEKKPSIISSHCKPQSS